MKIILFIIILFIFNLPAKAQKEWSLHDCINYAIEHNLQVKKQEIAKKEQAIELQTSQLKRLPNLNGNISQDFQFGRSLNDYQYVNQNSQSTGISLNSDIPIFTGLQIPNTIAMNKLNLKAAIEELNKAKEDISIQVTSAFLQVLFNEELYQVSLEQVNLSKEQTTRIEKLNEVGKAAISEVYEAKARIAQDELSAVQANNNLQLALLELSQLLELSTPEGFVITKPINEPDFTVLSSPEDVFNQAVMTKPGILAARYRMASAEKNIKVVQSSFYPQLSFGASMGTSYYHPYSEMEGGFGKQLNNHLSTRLGFSLSIPLFNRLDTRNRVKTARLQYFNHSLVLEESKKDLYKEIQQAYYNAVAAQSKFSFSGKAMEANESAFRLMKEKYDNGKATSVEYNETRLNLLKATSDKIQAKYDYIFRTKILDFYKGENLW